MSRVPAICTSCGAFFPSPIGIAPGSTNVTLAFNVVTQGCPHCGGTGRVLDGTFDFVGDAIRLVSGPGHTVRDLERLEAILRDAQERQAPIEDIQQEVSAQVPRVKAIANLLPKTRPEAYAFYIPLLVLIIQLAVGAFQKGETPKIEVNQVINQVLNQNITINQNITSPQQEPPAAQSPPRRPVPSPKSTVKAPKIGRNDPCPRGSGKKYKKCHGSPEDRSNEASPRSGSKHKRK